ncbi:MAG TPA: hypothetical protein ENN07_01035 [candidate division Zixibacteria bacterium]|nr:hypothetical protein [candidate division Zixibacteria bacterium]
MKKTLLLFFALCFVITAFAQFEVGISLAFPREIAYPCNSAGVATGQTYFHADFIDTLNSGSTTSFPVTSAKTHISTNGGTSWLTPLTMSSLTEMHYEDTWQSSRTNAASGNVMYYFQCETESTFTTETPKNDPVSFPLPANKSAHVNDPTGDHEPAEGKLPQ